MKNLTASSITSRPPDGLPRSFGLFFADAVLGAAFFLTCFLVLTNAVPLIQWGMIAELKSKMRYARTGQISVLIFTVLLWAVSRRRALYEKLWWPRFLRGLEATPVSGMLLGLWVSYAGTFAYAGVLRHLALETRAFDLGIFTQALWTTLQGDPLYSSLKGGICLLGDHFSPILFLVAPFYSLWPDPRMVLILQAAVMGSSILLIGRFTARRSRDTVIGLVFGLLYFFYRPGRNVLLEDFHPEVLVEPLLFLISFFLLERKKSAFLLTAAGILMAKENMPGVVFGLGLYAILINRWVKTGLAVILFSMALFAVEISLIIPFFSKAPYFYAASYHEPWGYFLSRWFSLETWEYALKLFYPFLFLPILCPAALVPALPVFFQNILSENPTMRSFGFHYTIGLSAFLFTAAFLGFERLAARLKWSHSGKRRAAGVILVAGILASGPSEYYRVWEIQGHLSPRRDLIRSRLGAIPPEASVLTHNNFVPQAGNRRQIQQFSYLAAPSKAESALLFGADYVVMAREFWEPQSDPLEKSLSDLLDAGYQIDFEADGFYVLKKTGLNP